MNQILAAVDAGLIALDAGIDKTGLLSANADAAVHLFCAVALAVVGVYIAQPAVQAVRARFRRQP